MKIKITLNTQSPVATYRGAGSGACESQTSSRAGGAGKPLPPLAPQR